MALNLVKTAVKINHYSYIIKVLAAPYILWRSGTMLFFPKKLPKISCGGRLLEMIISTFVLLKTGLISFSLKLDKELQVDSSVLLSFGL